MRKNFVLVYELLDEVIDYGFPQSSSSEALKEFVLNDPTIVKSTVSGCGPLPKGRSQGVLLARPWHISAVRTHSM